MMRRRQRGDVLVAPEIPLDMMIEIVNRLPIKSLARFKCVSKLWSSLISSQGSFFPSSPRLCISSIAENKYELLLLSLVSTSKSSNVFNLDMSKQGIGGYDMMSLRGLILYTVDRQAFIYNPTTEQRIDLPAIKFHQQIVYYFLGYDPVLDQYKVVCSAVGWLEKLGRFYSQHWVFVLESGSSWKRIEFDNPYYHIRQRVCTKGVIYYLAFSNVYGRIVISFDVRSEEFNIIQVPSLVYEYLDSLYLGYLGLIEYGGKPTIFDYKHLQDPSGLVNLWVLEDAGKWSRKSLVLQPCLMHFFPSSIYFEVIGTTQNGEVIFEPDDMYSSYYILYYDLNKNDVRRVDIKGISEGPFEVALMDTGESIMHLKI